MQYHMSPADGSSAPFLLSMSFLTGQEQCEDAWMEEEEEEGWSCEEEGCDCWQEDFRAGDERKRENEALYPRTLAQIPHGTGNCPTNHSSRVLHHPSFQAYYSAVALHQGLPTPDMDKRKELGFTFNCADYFYSDPLMSPGHRTYNCLSPGTQKIFSCFSLDTPPPIMAPCESPAAPASSHKSPPAAPASSYKSPAAAPASSYKSPPAAPASSHKSPAAAPASSHKSPAAAPASSYKSPPAAPASSYKSPPAAPTSSHKSPPAAPASSHKSPPAAPASSHKSPPTAPASSHKSPPAAPASSHKSPPAAPASSHKSPPAAPASSHKSPPTAPASSHKSPPAAPLAPIGSSHMDTRGRTPPLEKCQWPPLCEESEMENQELEPPSPGGDISTFPQCSPSEADAVCALLSLSGSCPPPAGQSWGPRH
ncbi:sialidase isoform X1 [Xenopus laevis]|uniref:Sialidase isoform X1 n=2 Tax=Xenopus laevis TaxID=8355 RepID=A0A8J0UTR1_XENLA|nr:sialidase isoform X1 [Xenopus laevis]